MWPTALPLSEQHGTARQGSPAAVAHRLIRTQARGQKGPHDRPCDVRVLNIGSGSGLLALLANKAGASYVTGCEARQHLVTTGQAALKANGVLRGRKRGKVRLVASDVRAIDKPPPAERNHIIVTDLFDCQVRHGRMPHVHGRGSHQPLRGHSHHGNAVWHALTVSYLSVLDRRALAKESSRF